MKDVMHGGIVEIGTSHHLAKLVIDIREMRAQRERDVLGETIGQGNVVDRRLIAMVQLLGQVEIGPPATVITREAPIHIVSIGANLHLAQRCPHSRARRGIGTALSINLIG
jgi:hypothetical protein